jgi:preprotein translocase subunit YajC
MAQLNFLAVMAQADATDGGGLASSLVLFGVIGFVFYFFMIRPQRRRVSEQRALHDSLDEGDEVRTVGGMLGRIESIDDDLVVLDMGGGTRLRFARQAIAMKVTEAEE